MTSWRLDATHEFVELAEPLPEVAEAAVPAKPAAVPRRDWPAWAERLATQAQPGDEGLGDVAARVAAKLGLDKLSSALKAVGVDCGCEARREWLNEHYKLKG